MVTKTILVIDDSATIRKMVDSHLSQEGYRVALAINGELGIEMARELIPDLILLDHQLPGTTGIDVCRKIIQFPECRNIPFLVSSTLRKKAYVEYMDMPNVVDSLPKPFKPELLLMAVANALETGAMIMSSQANGTAVPEVVGEVDQAAFSGDFRWLGLREVLDFLNNGQKDGVLEVELPRNRVSFFLKEGRIQGVVSSSFNESDVAKLLPEALKELGPLLKFTMSTGASTQMAGLAELVDRKIIDPRMLRTLLRHQAAVLTRHCFLNKPGQFSFMAERKPPLIFAKSGLDTCLAALLIDGALNCPTEELAPVDPGVGWSRHGLRGQNLDRAGLSAKHIQLLSHLDSTPRGTEEIFRKSELPREEVSRVLEGFLLAEWVQRQVLVQTQSQVTIVYEPDPQSANLVRAVLADTENAWSGQVVRDHFGLQLLLKRRAPDVVLIALEGDQELGLPEAVRQSGLLATTQALGLIVPGNVSVPLDAALREYVVIRRPYSKADLLRFLDQIRHRATAPVAKPESRESIVRTPRVEFPSVAGVR